MTYVTTSSGSRLRATGATGATSAEEGRRRCDAVLDRWTAGDAAGAWDALDAVEAAARAPEASEALRLVVLSTRATLLLRAERPDEARAAALLVLARAGERPVAGPDRVAQDAVLDARVTWATASLGADAEPADEAAALAALDDVVASAPGTRAAGRAVNNALLTRTGALEPRLRARDVAAQVTAWTAVGDARRRTHGTVTEGIVVRQAVDLAFLTGSWTRGWEAVVDGIASEPERTERIALHAKAALLAWERGDSGSADARHHGGRARDLSVAVDIPWVRLYAHLGGVVADLASGVAPATALGRYARCVPREDHARRPARAWSAAVVALDAGAATAAVVAFLDRVGVAELVEAPLRALLDGLLAQRDGRAAPLHPLEHHLPALSAPHRARAHLVLAREHLRRDRRSAAELELLAARQALHEWPGRVHDAVSALTSQRSPARVTRAQERVLDLLVEGLTNEQVATELGCSPRTVAVHVSRLLAATGTRSRTELAVHELRHRFRAATSD